MAAHFNPPPGWPPAPQGWTPPPGWAPDPSWPPPPPGWQLWIDDVPANGAAGSSGNGVPAPDVSDVSRFASPDSAATQVFPAQTVTAPTAPAQSFATQTFPAQGTSPLDKQSPDGAPAPVGAPAAFAGAAPSGQPGGFDAQHGGWQGGPGGFPPAGPPAGPPTAGKQWLIPVIIAVVALLAIFGVLIATGVIGGDSKASEQSEKSAKPSASRTATATEDASEEPSEEPSEKPSAEPTDAPAVVDNGTRAAPLAPGAVATLTTWTVSMGATNQDAWGEISTGASEYYAPEAGSVYLMAPATVTFTGDNRSTVDDLKWVFVSAAGTTYDDRCKYSNLPDELDRYQELYTDATATGNVCVTVPADQVADGVWRVEQWWEDGEAYVALS